MPVCFVEGVGESSLSGDKQLHSMLPAGYFLAAVEIEGDRFGEGQFIFARPPVAAYGTGILIRKGFMGRPDRLTLLSHSPVIFIVWGDNTCSFLIR